MFKKRDNTWFLVLLAVQSIIVVFTFRGVLFDADKFLLVNSWDGLKNYFTYYAYIKQPASIPFFQFSQLNYPFGDNVLYTDNTPLLAVLVKAISRWVIDLEPYSLFIHNAFMVSGIVISSGILYRIFRRFYTPQGIAFAAALFLPWISPMALRLKIGHFNLSFSWVLLLVIYLLLKLYTHFPKKQKCLWLSLALVCTLVTSAFLHMYYLLLNLSFIGFFFLFWLIRQASAERTYNGWLIALSALNVLVPPAIVLAIIRLPDKNYHLRRSIAEGYDRPDWRLNLEAFTTHYEFTKVKLKFLNMGHVPYESYLYLGLFFISTVIMGSVLWFWLRRQPVKKSLPFADAATKKSFLWLFGLSAAACGFIALGETISFFNGKYTVTNYFNLFYYIHKFSAVVTQFRVLSRFGWIIFWFCNIAAVCWLGFIWRNYPRPAWLKAIPVGLLFLMALDARDARKYLAQAKAPNVMSDKKELRFMAGLVKGIPAQNYQAILPVPLFHEGSEDYDISIFPDDVFFRGTIQLSEVTGLPVMGSKLSRTPPSQVRHLLSIFLSPIPDTVLTNALNSKPVLVLYNGAYYHKKNKFYKDLVREPALTAYKEGETIAAAKGWKKLRQAGDYILYEANLK